MKEHGVQIGLGGGCHWCTEGVFQALRGVTQVDQGFIQSEPPADTWSTDNNYLLSFPNGVDNIELLNFVIKRSGATETVTVALNSNGNDSEWTCGTINGVPGTQRCYAASEFVVTPSTA